MALTTTTLASPVLINATSIVVTSPTGFAAGKVIRIDDEIMITQQGYAGTPTVGVLRGRDGTASQAHPTGTNVITGFSTDFQLLPAAAMNDSVLMPGGTPGYTAAYSASGAIALPTNTGITVAMLIGTAALTMTLANPTLDLDGAVLIVIGNGKAAHVLQVGGTSGIGNAGAGYRNLTYAVGAQNGSLLVACNGAWVPISVYGGTTTAIQAALS